MGHNNSSNNANNNSSITVRQDARGYTLQFKGLNSPTMAYVSKLDVSLNDTDEQNLRARGFTRIDADLNKGAGGSQIYLWYKTGPTAITKIQVSFTDHMAVGLSNAGYQKIGKDLNAGAGGDAIYLWFYCGNGEYDTPITAIDITTEPKDEAAKFTFGWQRLACDLNRGAGGNSIHIWVKREQTFICDITATASYAPDVDLFESGYIRVDEDTNRRAGGSWVFIWYRQTTDPERALTDLQVAVGDEQADAFQNEGYTLVKTNLNDGTSGDPVYLFHKKVDSDKPIKAVALLLNQTLVPDYEKAGLIVIDKSLNSGNCGSPEYLCLLK